MANDLSRNPWVIDTASANYLRSGTATPSGANALTPVNFGTGYSGTGGGINLGKGPISISHLNWNGYTTGAGDNLVIKDVNGRPVFTTPGRADKTAIDFDVDFPWVVWDLAVTTLSSGILTITLVTR